MGENYKKLLISWFIWAIVELGIGISIFLLLAVSRYGNTKNEIDLEMAFWMILVVWLFLSLLAGKWAFDFRTQKVSLDKKYIGFVFSDNTSHLTDSYGIRIKKDDVVTWKFEGNDKYGVIISESHSEVELEEIDIDKDTYYYTLDFSRHKYWPR